MGFIDQSQLYLFFLALFLSSTHAIGEQKQNSVFSLSLHPRDSVTNPQYHNHTARLVSRLARDSARLKYMNSRLRNAANSELEEIQAPLTVARGGGEYLARIGVGEPVKEFYLLADTGSDILWLQCLPCTKCYSQSDPIFDPSKSSSYKPLPCASRQCVALSKLNMACGAGGTCKYHITYGDNATSAGDYGTETVSFGSTGSFRNVAVGCGHDNEGNLGYYAGLIGLSRGRPAFPSQIGATSFSYCLVDADSNSSSTLEFNSTAPDDSLTIPLIRNPVGEYFYYVELRRIRVGKHGILIPRSVYKINRTDGTGGTIVDSGTTFTYLAPRVYNSVRDAFVKHIRNLTAPRVSFQGLDTCYDIPTSSASGVRVPSVSLQFSEGKTLSLPRENYFFPVAVTKNGELTKFCLAFGSTDDVVPLSIIGNVQQQGMRVTFDLRNDFIGFSPNKC